MNVRLTPLSVFHELARPAALTAGAFVAFQLILAAAATPAYAQDGSTGQLADRLDRMERTLRTLSREVYRGEQLPAGGSETGSGAPPSAANATRFDQKLAQFETELRELTGRVESLGHTVRQLNSRLDKLVSDVDFRLSSLERQRAAGQSGATGQAPGQSRGDGASVNPDAIAGKPLQGSPQVSAAPRAPGVNQDGPATGGPITGTGTGRAPRTLGTITEDDLKHLRDSNPAAALDRQPQPPRQQAEAGDQSAAAPGTRAHGGVLPEGSAEEQYKFAFSLLRQADYEQASRAFEAFIEAHPDTDLTPNARYWLGETYYVRGDYRTAAEQFLTGYQKNPKGSKAADSLLKLGMSLIGLEQSKEACATFDKLSADFPSPPANITKVLARERARAECS